MRARRRKSALWGRARPANAQTPGNGDSQDQELPRVVPSVAGGRLARHTNPGRPEHRAVTFGNRGARGGDVPRLWCSGRQPATCTFVRPRRRASKPTPAVGPRDFPLPEAQVRQPPSGLRQRPTYGHRCQEPEASGTRRHQIPENVKHTHRHHLRGPLSCGSPAWRKC